MNAAHRTALERLLPPAFAEVVEIPLAPVADMASLASRFADEEGTVALLSGGDHDSARFDVVGIRPWLVLSERSGRVDLRVDGRAERLAMDPFDALETVASRFALPGRETAHPLSAGLLGYLAYDLKEVLEVLPRTSVDDLGLPRLWMAAPSILVVRDRRTGATTALSPVRGSAAQARALLETFASEIAPPVPARDRSAAVGGLVSGLTRAGYVRAVESIRDYIARGHVYQVNMSQRFATSFEGDAFGLFLDLWEANPAPFFAFVQAGDHQIACTSPERFLELRDGKVETRPIKGTRPRGRTPEEDTANRRDLETSPKDDSELSMIVDLLRNDIGRVCAAGSVKVVEHKRLEAYENVFHLVSRVEGVLDEGQGMVDLLRATFPGGSITGCPKIRAMEVIDELEPVRRHVYTGSVGYLGFRGSMDLNIAIRTATVAAGRLVYSVGGGVVYDSKGDDEYEETLHKGRTIARALERLAAGRPEAQEPTGCGWMDGRFLPIQDMTVSVQEDGYAHGYGLFETIRAERGRVLRLDAHLRRLRRGWDRCFPGEFPDVGWGDVLALLLERNGLADGVAAARLQVSAGRPGDRPRLSATVRPYRHRLAGTGRDALRLAVFPERRGGPLGALKSANYLLQRLAGAHARAADADEAVLLDPDGSASETNTGNLLLRLDDRWTTPDSPHALPGTMLEELVARLERDGSPVERRPVGPDELLRAEAVFVTNALMGAVPAGWLDGKPLARHRAEEDRIADLLRE